MQYVQPKRGVSRLPSALHMNLDPWSNALKSKPAAAVSRADSQYLAFGSGGLTQDPRYRSANLPPYNAAA